MLKDRYNYLEEMTEDVKNYITEEVNFSEYSDREDLEEKLYDALWVEDSVTGNASGSYWFNSWKAEEALVHNLDLLGEALDEFGCEDARRYLDSPETADVTIRCYLLGQAISAALDELEIDDDTFTEAEEIDA